MPAAGSDRGNWRKGALWALCLTVPLATSPLIVLAIFIAGTLVAFGGFARQAREELGRARDHVRGTGSARGLRDAMRTPRPGARSPRARSSAAAGPLRRIIRAGVAVARARVRKALDDRRRSRASRGRQGRQDRQGTPGRRRGRPVLPDMTACWDCGQLGTPQTRRPHPVQVRGRLEIWLLCPDCARLHRPPVPEPSPGRERPAPGVITGGGIPLPGPSAPDAIPAPGMPELAPAQDDPPAIGANTTVAANPVSPWVPRRPGSGLAVHGDGTTPALTHGAWMKAQAERAEAVGLLARHAEAVSAQLLACEFSEGSYIYTEGAAIVAAVRELSLRLAARAAEVNAIEAPVVAARELAGGPATTARTSWYTR
jgi:hypothetical protein